MLVKILDIQTNEVKWLTEKFTDSWWKHGNGSCDCNRALFFRNDDIECTSNRYFILEVKEELDGSENNSCDFDIDVFYDYNDNYDLMSVHRCLMLLNRNEKIETILK